MYILCLELRAQRKMYLVTYAFVGTISAGATVKMLVACQTRLRLNLRIAGATQY